MVSRPHIVARTATFSVLLVYFVLTGCHSSSKISAPTLAFSKVPATEQESPYKTPEQTESLPIVGNGVVTLAVVNGEGPGPVLPSPKMLNFSGYEWTTSSGPIFHAGSRNFFDPANVWTDERGALHLRISGSPGKWTAAELKLTRSLGYGTYRFQLRD